MKLLVSFAYSISHIFLALPFCFVLTFVILFAIWPVPSALSLLLATPMAIGIGIVFGNWVRSVWPFHGVLAMMGPALVVPAWFRAQWCFAEAGRLRVEEDVLRLAAIAAGHPKPEFAGGFAALGMELEGNFYFAAVFWGIGAGVAGILGLIRLRLTRSPSDGGHQPETGVVAIREPGWLSRGIR